MMRAGKDYLTKAVPEYEDRRSAHLRELCSTLAAQGNPQEPVEDKKPSVEKDDGSPKLPIQAKPTLKLKQE